MTSSHRVCAPLDAVAANEETFRPLWIGDGPLRAHRVLRALHEEGYITTSAFEQGLANLDERNITTHACVQIAGLLLLQVHTKRFWDLEALMAYVARRTGMRYVRLDPLTLRDRSAAEWVPEAYAQAHGLLPLSIEGDAITVAVSEPFVIDWLSLLERERRCRITRVLVNPTEMARYRKERFALAGLIKQNQEAADNRLGNLEQLIDMHQPTGLGASDEASIARFVDWLWRLAFSERASDIHLEPRRDACAVRLRIDGKLHKVYDLPPAAFEKMVARIKILARMDVSEKRRPQDGRLKTRNLDDQEVELRLSTLPTAFGEKLVMRIFDPSVAAKDPKALGFEERDAARWQELLTHNHGIILVTGPTGSGKTTTLYSSLKQLANESVNVSTIEDPVEMIEPAFNQTQVNPVLDFHFVDGLRALMRQDPDIIMVGEIRDAATAHMAIQAALTGHLVFSTLHTNDAPSAITRLLELGVAPYLINATLRGVLAQRLVRSLCSKCKLPQDDSDAMQLLLQQLPADNKLEQLKLYQARGCDYCRQTGFLGRVGIYELLVTSTALKQKITQHACLDELKAQAQLDGMHTLKTAAAVAVARGVTTLAEMDTCS